MVELAGSVLTFVLVRSWPQSGLDNGLCLGYVLVYVFLNLGVGLDPDLFLVSVLVLKCFS